MKLKKELDEFVGERNRLIERKKEIKAKIADDVAELADIDTRLKRVNADMHTGIRDYFRGDYFFGKPVLGKIPEEERHPTSLVGYMKKFGLIKNQEKTS